MDKKGTAERIKERVGRMPRIIVRCGVLVATALVIASIPVAAHHSLNAGFDETKIVTLKGLVSKVEWVNPHVYLYVDVADESGKTATWQVETFPPNTLRRAGLTRDKLGYGQIVTVTGYAAKNGANVTFLRQIMFPDGKELLIGLGDPESVR